MFLDDNSRKHGNLPFWLFTSSVLILLTAPTLIQDGMFFDAMLYTCVSHNLSLGTGTFWFPQFSPSNFLGFQIFLEHPPLVFGIQSLFFRLLGDSMYVERFYTFLTMCITAYLINVLWRDIFKKEEEIRQISWLPVLFWITIPACIWSYSNNMLENSMTIFDICAVIFILRAIESEKPAPSELLLSGIFIFLATFSKGVPGLFPIIIPFLHWLVFRKNHLRKTILNTLIISIVPFCIYLVLFNLPQSRESLQYYVKERLLARIAESPVVSNRLYILKRLLTELIPQLIVLAIYITISKIKKTRGPLTSFHKRSSFFILAGLSASVPLALTFVQRGFYLVPSFPYFAIGISALLATRVSEFRVRLAATSKIRSKFLLFTVMLFISSICITFLQKGKTQRDREMLHDVHSIGQSIPAYSAIGINNDVAKSLVLECYFIRYYNISFNFDGDRDYLMVLKDQEPEVAGNYQKLPVDTKVYDVYIRKKGEQ